MIRSLRAAQRGDLELYADALGAWVRGESSLSAEAAGQNVAEVLVLLREAHRARE